MTSDPLYVRFFGLGEDQVARILALILNPTDVYFVRVDHYEVVIELVDCKESRNQIKLLIHNHLQHAFIGYGKDNSIEQIVGDRLIKNRLSITGAESLTAGMFQAVLGNVPGISAVFPGGFVTYSNHAKHQLLKIPSHVIDKYGVVSKPVAEWMANQSRKIMQTDVSVSFTGAAGPASLEGQPAGTVWIGLSVKGQKPVAYLYHLVPLYYSLNGFKSAKELRSGIRNGVRLLSVKTGLKMVNDIFN